MSRSNEKEGVTFKSFEAVLKFWLSVTSFCLDCFNCSTWVQVWKLAGIEHYHPAASNCARPKVILSGNCRGSISHANIAVSEAVMKSGFSGPKLQDATQGAGFILEAGQQPVWSVWARKHSDDQFKTCLCTVLPQGLCQGERDLTDLKVMTSWWGFNSGSCAQPEHWEIWLRDFLPLFSNWDVGWRHTV